MLLKTNVMYEVEIDRFALHLKDGREFYFPETLSNGRANYVLFENLVRHMAELFKTKGSDHEDELERKYEQKAYLDPVADPKGKRDLVSVSSSNTFQANKFGKLIKGLLGMGERDEAYELIHTNGYSKNNFYVLTNTANYSPDYPFRFFFVTKEDLLACLDTEDPRMASRTKLLNLIEDTVQL